MMYCIYSGKEIHELESNDELETNEEHIIPLSLGGSDDFTIRVSKEYNDYLGSNVDGKMTQDFFIAMDRVRHQDKGHSQKEPRLDVKSEIENGKPAITSFTKDNMKVFDPVHKKYVDIPPKIKMETKLDLDIRTKFTAKVALATGYFLFGDTFVKYSDCDSLRNIMMSDNLKETLKKPGAIGNIRFFDPLLTGKECETEPMFQVYKLFIESNNATSVVWTFSEKSCIVFVAIYGKFIGMINFEAMTAQFPITDDFWLGHVLICQNKKLIRMSWRNAIIEMCEKTGVLDDNTILRFKNFKG